MKIKRKMEIEVRQNRIWLIENGKPAADRACSSCAGRGTMLSVTEARQIANISSRAIYRMVESGQLHFQETADGSLLVCSESLSAAKPSFWRGV